MHAPSPWTPAALGPRIVAGLIDFALLGSVGLVIALGPLWLGGLALPMVGAVAAVLVVNVLPLAAFRATLGLRLMGLEVVHSNGRAADLTELLFRELIGRGLLGVAFFTAMVIGGAGMLTGVMSVFSLTRLGLLGLLALCVMMLGFASHLVVLGSRDRRGLHDLMGGTWVVLRGTVSDPRDDADLDEESQAVLGATGGRRWPKVVAAQVIITALAVVVPYALSRPAPDAGDYEARAKMKQARSRFLKDPADRGAAVTYTRWARRAGEDPDDIEQIWSEHRAARTKQLEAQEAAIRAGLEGNPADWDRTASLVRLLEEQDRLTEARAALETWANAENTVSARVSLGIWLYENGFAKDARDVLRDAQAEGADSAELYAYLGWTEQELGDRAAALQALRAALERAPELEQVRADVDTLTEALENEHEAEPAQP